VRGLEAILAESVHTVTDAAGEYTALATPLEGRARVARLYLMAALHRQAGGTRTEIRLVNGLPAALITLQGPVRRQAPRTLLRCEMDPDGRIVLCAGRAFSVQRRTKWTCSLPSSPAVPPSRRSSRRWRWSRPSRR
jgi:hypothetical protein